MSTVGGSRKKNKTVQDLTTQTALIIAVAYACIAVGMNALVWHDSLLKEATYLNIFDAKGYHALGHQIWTDDKIDGDRLAQRGYLFSSVAYALISVHPIVLFAGQVMAIAVGVWALVHVEYRMTGWIRLSLLLLLVPSLWLAPSHMMTESISFACASTGFLLLLTRHGAWAAVVLWAGALVKPALLLGAMVSLVVTIRCRLILPLVVVTAFLMPQFILTSRHSDGITLSTAGAANFAERFHPAAMGVASTGNIVRYRDPAAEVFRNAAPKLSYKIADIIGHPVATAKTWVQILVVDHLWQSSGFLARNIAGLNWTLAGPIRTWSLWVNVGLALLIPFAVVGIVEYLRSVPYFRWPAAFMGPSILLLAPLVYWQGDRIVFIGLFLLMPFASLAIRRIVRPFPIRPIA